MNKKPNWMKHWMLDETHNLVEAPDLLTWAQWLEDFDNRRVAETVTQLHRVSTVFLGIDHGFSERGPPICFETMVFENTESMHRWRDKLRPYFEEMDCWRYATWDDAVAGHNAAVKRWLKAEADALAATGLTGKIKLRRGTVQ